MSDKDKTKTTPAPVSAPVNKSPLEKAMEAAAAKIPKLYSAMEEDVAYGDVEVVEALGLKVTDVNVKAVALQWHKMYDEGKVGAPHYYKPASPQIRGRKPLPKV
jgi:hypothetical protein